MKESLVNRLLGITNPCYTDGESVADCHLVMPSINLEAANHIQKLEELLNFKAALLQRALFSNYEDNVLREQFFKSLMNYSDKIDN